MSIVYVIPASYIAQINYEAIVDFFVRLGKVNYLTVWRNRIPLLKIFEDFCNKIIEQEGFKKACESLFPELKKISNDIFFKEWAETCCLHPDIDARIETVEALKKTGEDVVFIGELDCIQFAAINAQLSHYKKALVLPEKNFSFYSRCSSRTIIDNLLLRYDNVYYVSSPPPPKPYASLGLFGWCVAPFQRWLHSTHLLEAESILAATAEEQRFVIIGTSVTEEVYEVDEADELLQEVCSSSEPLFVEPFLQLRLCGLQHYSQEKLSPSHCSIGRGVGSFNPCSPQSSSPRRLR